ncbi:MAG TPA: PQQ-dependent sugar dehydrogenase [Gaiellaceae bacterium]|nr:PQQ-dependent sugar dehydrogenase [Gaiellaceae bacterium]
MHRPGVYAVCLAVLALALAVPGAASAVRLVKVADGFGPVTQVTAARSGDPAGTLYVVEKEGRVWKLRQGARSVFLDIRGSVSTGNEQGLFSIAFDAAYATNHLVYVNFTNRAGDTRVVRYRARANHSRVRPGTRRTLLRLPQPAGNHNGGHLAFGPNGRLYSGQGDGGGSCDPGRRAQNLRSRHGKLLSIDPRAAGQGWRIDAYGLRNPWRYSFDRRTGRLYVGDVGQAAWEEVSTLPKRRLGGTPENFLWNVYEGLRASGCAHGGLRGPGKRVWPVSVYGRSLGCSITGGYVYRGSRLSGLRGRYVFGDYCTGRIWRIHVKDGKLAKARRQLLDTNLNISSFGESAAGELFVAHLGGAVYRLAPS